MKLLDCIKKFNLALIIITCLCFMNLVPVAFSQGLDDDYYTINFPAGTFIKGILTSNLSSSVNNIGDSVELIIPADIKVTDITCIPKNSKLVGRILRMGKAEQGKNAFFELIFETIKYPDGQTSGILGHIWNREGSGIIGGELTQRLNYKKIPHLIEGIGGVAQLVPDGPRKMGKETEVLAGSEWIVVLDKELRLKVSKDF